MLHERSSVFSHSFKSDVKSDISTEKIIFSVLYGCILPVSKHSIKYRPDIHYPQSVYSTLNFSDFHACSMPKHAVQQLNSAKR
ncbi:hypothetical protein CDG60_16370 [Acinetobacter chinensis]|uniref:Uncharacterized protein n=1 Tax=Acinetobacter chinensis TaxID=2004650 RepID=A0A3B7LYK5_9GAMM|nr:hypothetical protein CDG60_16370 [Acinetobacter chinensis]